MRTTATAVTKPNSQTTRFYKRSSSIIIIFALCVLAVPVGVGKIGGIVFRHSKSTGRFRWKLMLVLVLIVLEVVVIVVFFGVILMA